MHINQNNQTSRLLHCLTCIQLTYDAKGKGMYKHSKLLRVLSLYIWPVKNIHSTLLAVISILNCPAQIIQCSAGEFPPNHVERLMSYHQLRKNCNQLWLANPTDKYACQWSSSSPAQSFTGSHICQLDLIGTVDYTVFVSWYAMFVSIYDVNHTIVAPSLYIWPVQITQLNAANTVKCLTLHELMRKSYECLFLANQTDIKWNPVTGSLTLTVTLVQCSRAPCLLLLLLLPPSFCSTSYCPLSYCSPLFSSWSY